MERKEVNFIPKNKVFGQTGGGGVKISTVFPIGERRGGLVCKIAKW